MKNQNFLHFFLVYGFDNLNMYRKKQEKIPKFDKSKRKIGKIEKSIKFWESRKTKKNGIFLRFFSFEILDFKNFEIMLRKTRKRHRFASWRFLVAFDYVRVPRIL